MVTTTAPNSGTWAAPSARAAAAAMGTAALPAAMTSAPARASHEVGVVPCVALRKRRWPSVLLVIALRVAAKGSLAAMAADSTHCISEMAFGALANGSIPYS